MFFSLSIKLFMYVCLYAIPVGRGVGLLPHFDLFTLYLPHVTAYIVSTVEALGENLRYYSREIIRDFRARYSLLIYQ